MQLIRSVSYLILSLLTVGGLFLVALTSINTAMWLLAAMGAATLLIIIWVAVRRGESPPSPDKRLRRSQGAGRPIVLHFYSDFDILSMIKRIRTAPADRKYRGRVDFIHVSMLDGAGAELARRHMAGLGSFVLFDARGREAGRPKMLNHRILADLSERTGP